MKRISVVFLVFSGLALAGCETSPSAPTTPTTPTTPAVTSITQVLSGTLTPGDAPFHAFTIPGTQPLHITFGSLTDSTGVPLGSTVTLKFGVETTAGSLTCDPLASMSGTAALKAQINVTVSSGTYCVSLTDTAGVPVTANYAIRLIYGTPSDASSSGEIAYASTILPGGYTARTFGVAAAGVATITMDSFSPASVATLNVGLGFQRNDGSGCEVSTAMTATRGRELSVPVDSGKYCVKVFDLGTLTSTANFSLRILHP